MDFIKEAKEIVLNENKQSANDDVDIEFFADLAKNELEKWTDHFWTANYKESKLNKYVIDSSEIDKDDDDGISAHIKDVESAVKRSKVFKKHKVDVWYDELKNGNYIIQVVVTVK